MTILNGEVNFLTEDRTIQGNMAIREIEKEFDLIQLWCSMIKPFGFEARDVLDRFMALSLRKMLCDDNSILKEVCPGFKMPPLKGKTFECPGENNEMKLVEINPSMNIKPKEEWIPIEEWLDERIAWIDKNASSIPDAYEDGFFRKICDRQGNRGFQDLFACRVIEEGGKKKKIWEIKDRNDGKKKVYELLKEKGYYDLTIRRMIKHVADKQGAHIERKNSIWIRLANSGEDNRSAISVFATQMIYAATMQIKGLENYNKIITIET